MRAPAFTCALTFACFGIAYGQAELSANDKAQSTHPPEVTVNVLPERKDDIPLPSPSALQIFDDGAAQRVETISGPGTPVSLCLLIDLSASMARYGTHIRDAAVALLRGLPRGSEAMIVVFRDDPVVALPLTAVNDINAHAFDQLSFAHKTAMLDSLIVAEQKFIPSANYPRRAMVVITDLVDTHSRHRAGDAKRSILRRHPGPMHAQPDPR